MDPGESGGEERLWAGGDPKAVQCLTDIFTSVFTTCDVPQDALLGPCVLSHSSLYDSIAFIALKATDKRTAPYIFRVRRSSPRRGCTPHRTPQNVLSVESDGATAHGLPDWVRFPRPIWQP